MNKCLVRKLLEAGQRIGKSISRSSPPPQVIFFVSGHFKNFLNTIYFTPWPTPQGGRGQRFLVKFITGHFKSFFKRFFLPPPSSHIETQWWRAWMCTKLSIFVNWPWTALCSAAKLVISKTKILWWKAFEDTIIFLIHGRGQTPPIAPPPFSDNPANITIFL